MAGGAGGWRGDGEVALGSTCIPHAGRGLSKLAVERRAHRVVATGGDDGSLRLLDLRSLSAPARAEIPPAGRDGGGGHAERVEALAWLPEDNRLFVSGGGTSVKIWDASATSSGCVVPVELLSAVRGVAVTDGPPASAAVALADRTVRILDLRIGRAVSTMQGHTSSPLCVTYAPAHSEPRLFSGGMDGTVRAWDPRMGARSLYLFDPYAHEKDQPPLREREVSEEEALKSRGAFGKLRDLRASSSSAALAPGVVPPDLGGTCRVEPYRFRATKSVLSHSTGNMSRAPETGGGSLLAAPRSAGLAELADLTAEDRERRERWSRDNLERERHLLDPPRREFTQDPSCAHRGAVIALAFAPGTHASGEACPAGALLSCGVDGKVRCWDASKGTLVGKPAAFGVECWTNDQPLQIGAGGAPEDLCFVPEKDLLAAYCVRTGERLCHLAAHTSTVNCAEALPSCTRVLSGGADGRLICWRAAASAAAGEDVICLD